MEGRVSEGMRRAWCVFLLWAWGVPLLFSQVEEGPIPLEPYPTRGTGPSVEFGQAYQSVGPNMPSPQIGVLKVAPKFEMEQSKGRESIVTAELKALVFLDKE